MAEVVTLINMKGGVGKTTLTCNLACTSMIAGKKVLVVDLDPQFNASQFLMRPQNWNDYVASGGKTVYDIFEQFSPGEHHAERPEVKPGDVIYEVPPRWWGWDRGTLHIIPSRLELSWTLRNPASKEQLLERFLVKIRDDYDIILIDCPPTESMFTVAAYLASDSIVVPVRPEFLSTVGLPLLADSIRRFKKQYRRRRPHVQGVVFNMVQRDSREYRRAKQNVLSEAERNGWYLFENEISFSESYRKGARFGTPIQHTDYARWTVREEFEHFELEFTERVGL